MNDEFNPYAPPQSDILSPTVTEVALPLASRWHRLFASIVDDLICAAILFPLDYFFGTPQETKSHGIIASWYQFDVESIPWTAISILLTVGINWSFLAKGQTIGKRLFNLRVDYVAGGPCSRSHNITRRITIIQILYLIPALGNIITIVDSMMIFRENKRTLHDEIAGTKVVKLPS